MTRSAPLWLACPSRHAGISAAHARLLLAVVILLIALLTALALAPMPVADGGEAMLAEAIVGGVRHGEEYYAVAAGIFRAGDAAARPLAVVPLPTLAAVQAQLSPVAAALLLYALAIGALSAWYLRLDGVFRSPTGHLVAVTLAAGGMVAAVRAELVASTAVSAGLLIALSLAVRRRGAWQSAAALGLAAMLIDERAAIVAPVMGLLALRDGDRREALGWTAAFAVFGLAFVIHLQTVAMAIGPQATASDGRALGIRAALAGLIGSNALSIAPLPLAAALLGLSITGWSTWRDPAAVRVLALIAAAAVLIASTGATDAGYLVAPLIPLGLAFAPDGIRDLTRAALDRRRITVTRTSR